MGWPSVSTWRVDNATESLVAGIEVFDCPREPREVNPNEYPDQALLISLNRACIEWQIGLINQLADEPAASRWRVEPINV